MPAPQPSLRITTAADASGTLLRLAGECDLATADELREKLEQAMAHSCVVVDVAGLEFVDVAGLNVLLAASRQQRERGGRLVLRRPRPMVVRMLSLLDLADAVEIEP